MLGNGTEYQHALEEEAHPKGKVRSLVLVVQVDKAIDLELK